MMKCPHQKRFKHENVDMNYSAVQNKVALSHFVRHLHTHKCVLLLSSSHLRQSQQSKI